MLKKIIKIQELNGINVVKHGIFQCLENTSSMFEKTLAYCDQLKFLKDAQKNANISSLIIPPNLVGQVTRGDLGIITSDQPRELFYQLYRAFLSDDMFTVKNSQNSRQNLRVHPSAVIDDSAQIGNDCVIHANVTIGKNVILGNNITIHSGSVIGCDGILYDKTNKLIAHAGGVVIGDGSELLANSTIVSSISSNHYTSVGKNSIIGISSTIGHEAQIGNQCVISGNSTIARQAVICDNVLVGANSMVREYIRMHESSRCMAGSVVVKDVERNQVVSGNFAYDHKKRLREYAAQAKGSRK